MPKKTQSVPSGYPEEFLRCRDMRHAWEAVGYWRDRSRVRRTLACARCGCGRTDLWTTTGVRMGSSYTHPDGYLMHGSGRPFAAAVVRRAVVARVRVFASLDEMLAATGAR